MTVPPPDLFYLLTAAALAAQVWFWRRTALRGWPRISVAALRLTVIALVCWILTNPRRVRPTDEEARRGEAVVLIDASRSMDFPDGESGGSRREKAAELAGEIQGRGAASVAWFASGFHRDHPPEESQRGASLLAAAIRQTLASPERPATLVVISDGAAQDEKDLAVTAALCRQRGVPVHTLRTGGPHEVRNVSLLACDAPRTAKAATKIPVSVTVKREGCRDEALTVELVNAEGKAVDGATLIATDDRRAEQNVTLHCETGLSGFSGKVRVLPLEGESTLADNETPLAISSEDTKLRVLYMEGSTGVEHGLPEPCYLAQALTETGEIEVDLLALNISNTSGGAVLVGWPWQTPGSFRPDPSRGYPATREELYRYDVVICSDITQRAFTKAQIQWTVDLVAERGGGFIMIGGVTSFGTGGWDRTPWDKMIPLDMDEYSRGTSGNSFTLHWSEAGKRHPLLAQLPLQPGEKLEDFLNAHPPLLGTNIIRRAKPAATVLASMNDETGVPIFAVQSFGRGRSMAFTSDVTFQWGTLHNRAWGPPEAMVPDMTIEHYGNKPDAPTPVNNSYYKRFWRRSIQWLAENSARVRSGEFTADTPYLSWPGESALSVTASAPGESVMSRLAKGACYAAVKGFPATRTRLVYDSAAQQFTGAVPRVPGLPERAVVEVEARAPGERGVTSASFTVNVPRVDAESAHASARPEILEALSAVSGGKVLASAAEAASVLAAGQAELHARVTGVSVPVWPRWIVLTTLLSLLTAEWLIRRFST